MKLGDLLKEMDERCEGKEYGQIRRTLWILMEQAFNLGKETNEKSKNNKI